MTKELVKLGQFKIWTTRTSKAIHIPKWWVEQYTDGRNVELFVDADGTLVVKPVRNGSEGSKEFGQ